TPAQNREPALCRPGRVGSSIGNHSGCGKRRMRLAVVALAAFLACTCAPRANAIEPFFAPAVPVGSVDVRLHPTEGVPTGAPVLVTFGVPFPRGSLAPAAL